LSAAAAGGEGALPSVPHDHPAELLARVVFALAVIACFAAFLITQHLKHTPTAVTGFKLAPVFTPGGSGQGVEAISFEITSSDEVTVSIVDAQDNTVATLVSSYPLERYKRLSLRWNGHRGTAAGVLVTHSPDGHTVLVPRTDGALAPPGEYRVRVRLERAGREVRSPRTFQLAAP